MPWVQKQGHSESGGSWYEWQDDLTQDQSSYLASQGVKFANAYGNHNGYLGSADYTRDMQASITGRGNASVYGGWDQARFNSTYGAAYQASKAPPPAPAPAPAPAAAAPSPAQLQQLQQLQMVQATQTPPAPAPIQATPQGAPQAPATIQRPADPPPVQAPAVPPEMQAPAPAPTAAPPVTPKEDANTSMLKEMAQASMGQADRRRSIRGNLFGMNMGFGSVGQIRGTLGGY